MKIMQEGSLTKRVTCKRCKSELEYEPEDVKSTSYEDSGIKYHLQCPVCLKKLGESYSFVYVDEPSKPSKGVSTKFNLSIDLFTDDVRDAADVAKALRSVADRLGKFTSQPWSPYALEGKIYADGSKRLIGAWSVDPEAANGLTITAENDPDSRVHCEKCGEHIAKPKARNTPEVCAKCAGKTGSEAHT